MTEDQPAAPSVRDHLLSIFAGVLAWPETFEEVAGFVDDTIVGAEDKTVTTLWAYLCRRGPDSTRAEALDELLCAEVFDAVDVVDSLVDYAQKMTASKTVGAARKLARAVTNVRRKYALRQQLDVPAGLLDLEGAVSEVLRNHPHTTSDVKTLSMSQCERARTEVHKIIPSGFAAWDGFVEGEFHLIPLRTGDGKSTITYSLVRNQFFAHAAKHREGSWWDNYGSSWDGAGKKRLAKLLEPCHAGYDSDEDEHFAPHVIWFSLEEPEAQVLGRFYCDLLSLDRTRWVMSRKYRANIEASYAEELNAIDEVLTGGRLTIVDYSTRPRRGTDGLDEVFIEQTLTDLAKKMRQWARQCAKQDELEGVERPRLAFVDYAQLCRVPDEEARSELGALEKVSKTLRGLAPATSCALVATAMLLRDFEDNEPTKDQIKGSSQFAQDAVRIVVGWPMGKRARRELSLALELASPGESSDAAAAAEFERDVGGAFDEFDDEDGDEYEIPEDDDPAEAFDATGPETAARLVQATHEIRLSCEKDRFGPEWQSRLHFDGKHARVTDGLPDPGSEDLEGVPTYTSFREHPQIAAIIEPKTKRKKKD